MIDHACASRPSNGPVFGVLRTRTQQSRKRRKIIALIIFDQEAELIWGNHLDRVAPLVEMPGHLKPARRLKTDNEPTVVIVLHDLVGMEHVFPCHRGRPAIEAPDDGSKLGLRVEGFECTSCMLRQIEFRIPYEAVGQALRLKNAVEPKVADGRVSCGGLAAGQIASKPKQDAVGSTTR